MENIYLFDGAFGTYYHDRSPESQYPELANLHDPQAVLEIHREYLRAGVNAIKTNTFCANPACFPDRQQLAAIIRSGWRLAKEAAGNTAAVFADIGPIPTERAAADYLSVVRLFLEEGADRFLFETQSSLTELLPALSLIKSEPGRVVIVSFAVTQDGYTQSGESYQSLFAQAAEAGADLVGLNCICGPAHMLRLISAVDTQKYAVSAMPNAGYPSVVNGRTIYVDNPEYFSEKLAEIYACGVRAVGGCCGTTPRHIRAAVDKLRHLEPAQRGGGSEQADRRSQAPSDRWSPITIAAEIAAPADTDAAFSLEAAKRLKAAGADFITVPDSPLARTRAGSILTAARLQREAGICAIPHLCCRDRNQIAIKGDLLGGNIEGLRNVLAITGDPVPDLERGTAKTVFGFNSYKLIRFIRQLNDDLFPDSPYRIYAGLNTSAVNFAAELKRAEEKQKNGAVCFLTQPLFSDQNLENYHLARHTLSSRVLAGIMPLGGYKNALFLNNEVPGIDIPAPILEALAASLPEQARQICLRYAKEMVDRLWEDCDGFYIMTPLRKIELSEALITYIRRKTTC